MDDHVVLQGGFVERTDEENALALGAGLGFDDVGFLGLGLVGIRFYHYL